ncbi:MAG: recombinase family protein [Syntrophomonas sp.]
MKKRPIEMDSIYIEELLKKDVLDVAALYRVSSPGQVKGDDEVPIPAQQNAALKLCSSKKWNLVKEFDEPGVSAYRKSAKNRDVIHDVIREAKNGTFKVLLVFRANRLSRLEAEYPMILKDLKRFGVIVWEIARDKRLTPITHEEALTTYLDGWFAEGESRSISTNVKNGIVTAVTSGKRAGVFCCYGFEVKERYIDTSGRKPKMRSVFGINEKEADIIERLVEFYENGHGSKYTAQILNAEGYRTSQNAEWSSSYIRRILRNPAIAGIFLFRIDGKDPRRIHSYKDLYDPAYYVHKDNNGNYITDPNLTIIQVERWFNLMKIMDSLSNGKHINSNATKKYLLTGSTKCGYCGRSMVAVTHSEQYQKKDGTFSIYDKSAYRCTSHTLGLTCTGPYQIKISKIEQAFYEELELFFERFDPEVLVIKTENDIETINSIKNRIKQYERELSKAKSLKSKWLNELDEYFIRNGNYILSKENIAAKIAEQEEKIKEIADALMKQKKLLDSEVNKKKNLVTLSLVIPTWYKEFKDRSIEVQNKLLGNILSEVIVYRDRIDVNFSFDTNALANYNTNDSDNNECINIQKTVYLA